MSTRNSDKSIINNNLIEIKSKVSIIWFINISFNSNSNVVSNSLTQSFVDFLSQEVIYQNLTTSLNLLNIFINCFRFRFVSSIPIQFMATYCQLIMTTTLRERSRPRNLCSDLLFNERVNFESNINKKSIFCIKY